MKNKTLIFSATYNEKRNVINFFNFYKKKLHNFDLLIIDDNSPDKTINILRTQSLGHKNIKIISRKKKLGLDTATKLAFKYAIQKKYRNLITIDFDLQHDLRDIIRLEKKIKYYDFIIGSRYMDGGKCEMKGLRYFLSYYGNKLIKFILNLPLNEATTSLRAYNDKVINFLIKQNISNKGYSFYMSVVNFIVENNFSVKEIPIIFKNRKFDKSKIPKFELFRTLFYLTIFFLKKKIIFLKKILKR